MSKALEEAFRALTDKICRPALGKLRRAIAAEDKRRHGKCAEIVLDRLCESLIDVYETFVLERALDEAAVKAAADSIHGFVAAVLRSSLERMPPLEEKPKCSHVYARELTRARVASALTAHKWPDSFVLAADPDYAKEACDGCVVALMSEAARINRLTPALVVAQGDEEVQLRFLTPEEIE